MRPHGIMFHHFHGGRYRPSQGSISATQLHEMLQGIGVHRILPASLWLERAATGTLRADELCLTFDDNLRCQLDIALPVLRELKLTACWFVYSSVFNGNVERLEIYRTFRTECFEHIDAFYLAFFSATQASEWGDEVFSALADFEPSTYLRQFSFYTANDRRFRFVRDEVLGPQRYDALLDQMMDDAGFDISKAAQDLWMNNDDLAALAAEGHAVGLHSNTHPTRLAQLSFHEQTEEYRTNFNHLTQLLGTKPICMSHPCNSYNADTLAILQSLGIRVGFRSNMSDGFASPLEFPREDHANLIQRRAA